MQNFQIEEFNMHSFFAVWMKIPETIWGFLLLELFSRWSWVFQKMRNNACNKLKWFVDVAGFCFFITGYLRNCRICKRLGFLYILTSKIEKHSQISFSNRKYWDILVFTYKFVWPQKQYGDGSIEDIPEFFQTMDSVLGIFVTKPFK